MRILLVCWHRPVTVCRSVYWILREMGHEVITAGMVDNNIGWSDGHRYECYEWQPHVELKFIDKDQPLKVVQTSQRVAAGPLDLVLQMDRFIGGRYPEVPNVLYALDNHVGKYDGYAEFDRIYYAHSWGFMSELEQGRWLPCAYDPRYHFTIDPKAERPIDVLMLGNPYPHRIAFVEQLRARGVNVLALSGPVWQEYNTLYNQSKIALVISNNGDLSGRVFEHMAAGCLVVADKIPDMEKVGLENGKHYLEYGNVAECVENIKWALAYPCAMRDIAAAGHETGKPETWDARLETILSEFS